MLFLYLTFSSLRVIPTRSSRYVMMRRKRSRTEVRERTTRAFRALSSARSATSGMRVKLADPTLRTRSGAAPRDPALSAVLARGGGHDRSVERESPRRSVELRVAEGEHVAVRADEPVALAARRGRQRDDRCGERETTGRTEEPRVTERKHATVARHQPIAPPRRGARHPDDRAYQAQIAGGAVEPRVTEREHATVARHQPVAPP